MSVKGVWQLQKLTIQYCGWGGSSMFMRRLLDSPALSEFAEANPQVEVHVKVM